MSANEPLETPAEKSFVPSRGVDRSSSYGDNSLGASGPAALEDIVYNRFVRGFTMIRARAGDCSEEEVPKEGQKIHNCAVVNFIDPSSAGASLVTASGIPAKAPLELYQRMEAIFIAEYGSKLTYIQYKHFRSGALGVIESLNVRPVLSLGGLMSSKQDVPWPGTVLSGPPPHQTDPTEFHNAPYCHVYIASCDSLEQYRTQIKPSVKAFVSQLDSAAEEIRRATGSSENGSAKKESRSQYVIVFVPTGNNKDEVAGPASRVGAAFSRLRARSSSTTKSEPAPNSSTHSGDTETSDAQTEAESEENQSNALQGHLSKVDKEIARRFSVDFPGAKLCTLSTLFDEKDDAEHDERQKLEWSGFMKVLGAAIVDGFTERCRRYDEYIRKLDAARANISPDGSGEGFDMKHYFLVKESFAITYEQMQLGSEALLQYNELKAFIPDIKSPRIAKDVLEMMAGEVDSTSSIRRHSLSGDPRRFRRHFRIVADLLPAAPILEQYVFSRETTLLFKSGGPVDIVSRAESFAQSLFRFKVRLASIAGDKEPSLLVEAEKWAFSFYWDFRRAIGSYFDLKKSEGRTPEAEEVRIRFARALSSFSDFARDRYLSLGSLLFSAENPLKSIRSEMRDNQSWDPYSPPTETIQTSTDPENHDEATAKNFIEDAIVSPESYVDGYLDIMRYLAASTEICNRPRTAAFRRLEVANLCLRLQKYSDAASNVKMIANAFARNRWDSAAFLYHFRLAGLQRRLCTPQEYLETLINSFSEAALVVAPKSALKLLQQDFSAITELSAKESRPFQCTSVSPPAVFPRLSIVGVKSRSDRKADEMKYTKKFLNIGDKVTFDVEFESFFPDTVSTDKMVLDIVPFQAHVSAVEDSVALERTDVYKVIEKKGEVLNPGKTNIQFDWLPMEQGQFIVASVSIQVGGVCFTYPAQSLRQSTLRVDVVPCESTQTIEIQPPVLLSGHDQRVKIRFLARSDHVREGKIALKGMAGLKLTSEPPSDNSWNTEHTVVFDECRPGKYLEFPLMVRVPSAADIKEDDPPPSLDFESSTSFEFTPVDGSASDSKVAPLSCVVNGSVDATGTSTFLVKSTEMSHFSENGWMLSLDIVSRARRSLKLQDWKLKLPEALKLSENGDVNESFRSSNVVDGGQIGMCFICENSFVSSGKTPATSAFLTMQFTDEYGSKFSEALQVQMESFKAAAPSQCQTEEPHINVAAHTAKGPVTDTVRLCYSIQTTSLKEFPGTLTYSIDADHPDWLIAGPTEGQVNSLEGPTWNLNVEAIPCRSGEITSFPRAFLYHWENTTDVVKSRLITHQVEAGSFNSIGSRRHVSVAGCRLTPKPVSKE